MRNAIGILTIALAIATSAACSQQQQAPKKAAAPFDPKQFVTETVLIARSNAELGAMAAKKGRLDETRQFGTRMQQEHEELRAAFTAIAERKSIAVPPGIEQKKVALRDNLTILPGQVFDRGYTLAMVQDLRTMSRQMQKASASGDPALVQLSRHYLPLLQEQEMSASAVLKRLGGSPFGWE
jgi:predicted outer membrane protein